MIIPPDPENTLFEAVLRLARELLWVRQSVATDGDTTTLEDTYVDYPADTYIGGSIFFPGTSEYRAILDYASNIFTFEDLDVGITDKDLYAISDKDISLDVLISSINSAIQEMTLLDRNTDLVVVADTEEYDIPADVRGVLDVEIANSLTPPYCFQTHQHWDVIDDKLCFPANFRPSLVGAKIRLIFRRAFTALTDSQAAITAGIDLELLHWMAVENAAKYGRKIYGEDAKRDWAGKIQEAEVRLQRYKAFQVKPQRTPRLADW